MRNRIMKFMTGRYGLYAGGFDSLNMFLMFGIIVLGVLTLILSFFSSSLAVRIIIRVFQALEFLFFAWLIFRFLSKNISKRQSENMRFIRNKEKLKKAFKSDNTKTHRVYKCPQCRAKVRVPRGKGKIRITCPKCKATFIKRT